MNVFARPTPYTSKLPSVLFVLGVVVLVGTWVVLYGIESLFTEAFLVGYYCCVTEQDLPPVGTWDRTLSDFFRTSPGMHLPSLIFVAVGVSFFVIHMRRARRSYWRLPYLFIAFNIFYLLAVFWLTFAAWTISDWMVGPQIGVYKGYDRTWYGIVLHLLFWGGFFVILCRAPAKLMQTFMPPNANDTEKI